jgi:hypothetical protein
LSLSILVPRDAAQDVVRRLHARLFGSR